MFRCRRKSNPKIIPFVFFASKFSYSCKVLRKGFLLRARVLKLYRQALRAARKAPHDSRAELKQVIRQEMECHRDCKDRQKIRFLISEGTERLKGLTEMLGMQGHC